MLALNTDSKEMMKRSHIRHREFPAESSNDPLKKTQRGGRQYDVINIEKQDSHIGAITIYEH